MATAVQLTQPVPIEHHLRGFGGQFDCELFTEIGQPQARTPMQRVALEQIINRLKPGHSRIFVTPEMLGDTKARAALMSTLEIADNADANVNLTWWMGPYFEHVIPNPPAKKGEKARCRPRQHGRFIGKERMEGFAGVIEEARRREFGCITHVTIQNEVNHQDIGMKCDVSESQKLYKRLYTLLDNALTARPDPLGRAVNLRRTVDFVGGDLVAGGSPGVANSEQRHWLSYMERNMAKLLDGYSIHVYWTPGDTAKIDRRLKGLGTQIRQFGLSKPIYVTEYGVKAKTGDTEPGVLNGKNIEDTIEAAFEHAWFNALAPQYGCVGFAKWVLYRTDGPERTFKQWGMICPPSLNFRPVSPTYFVTWLFNHLVDPGWKAAGVWRSGDKDEHVLVAKFAAPEGGNHSLVALNRGSATTLRLAGLKKHFNYFSAVWNREGDTKPGSIRGQKPVPSDAEGNATVVVRRNELVALSTRPIMR